MSTALSVVMSKSRLVPGSWTPRSILTQVWSSRVQLSGKDSKLEFEQEIMPFDRFAETDPEAANRIVITKACSHRSRRPFAPYF